MVYSLLIYTLLLGQPGPTQADANACSRIASFLAARKDEAGQLHAKSRLQTVATLPDHAAGKKVGSPMGGFVAAYPYQIVLAGTDPAIFAENERKVAEAWKLRDKFRQLRDSADHEGVIRAWRENGKFVGGEMSSGIREVTEAFVARYDFATALAIICPSGEINQEETADAMTRFCAAAAGLDVPEAYDRILAVSQLDRKCFDYYVRNLDPRSRLLIAGYSMMMRDSGHYEPWTEVWADRILEIDVNNPYSIYWKAKQMAARGEYMDAWRLASYASKFAMGQVSSMLVYFLRSLYADPLRGKVLYPDPLYPRPFPDELR